LEEFRRRIELDIREYNREAWNRMVKKGSRYTLPASPQMIAEARGGNWRIHLTPLKTVPPDWLPDVWEKRILCLASGGGQQGPVLAAAGAEVTVLDNSPAQLDQDRLVAERESLNLTTVEGDMRDLHMLSDNYFDFIVHPVSNTFVPDLKPVWQEAFRVLRPGGNLLSGICNPLLYSFEWDLSVLCRKLVVVHKLPYSDLESLTSEQKARKMEKGEPFEFSHTLEEQIGGQIAAGFMISGFYEDRDNAQTDADDNPINQYMDTYFATRAVKPVR
jgi:SAM-dependent methyltransferase